MRRRLGLDVVADSCNPIQLTREEWKQTAREAGAHHRNIEVICSDLEEHQQLDIWRTPPGRSTSQELAAPGNKRLGVPESGSILTSGLCDVALAVSAVWRS